MINFGDYLYNYMQKNNLTISSVAAKAKIDRTLLSKAISGSRSLNRVTFKKLLSAIEPTYRELETLTELYAISYFGESSYNKIQFFIKSMKKHQKEHLRSYGECPGTEPAVDDCHPYQILNNTNEALDCIRRTLTAEWQEEHPQLDSNFPFHLDYINNLLFSLMDADGKRADFRHLICFSNNNDSNEELKTVLLSIRYQRRGYATDYYTCGDSKSYREDAIFPYYIITGHALLLLSQDLTGGLLVREPAIIRQYRELFTRTLAKSKEMIASVRQIHPYRELLLPYCASAYEMLYFGNILSFFITEDTVELLEFDRNDRETVAYFHDLCDINSHILSDFNFYTLLMNKDELSDFINSGVIKCLLERHDVRVSAHHKAKFMEYVFRFIQKKNVFFCLTNDKIDFFTGDDSLMVCTSDIYKNNRVLMFQREGELAGRDDQCIVIDNDTVVNTCCNFFEYCNLFSYTEAPETSLAFFEKQLVYEKRAAEPVAI